VPAILARIHLFVRDFAISEGVDETFDALQATPFGLPVHDLEASLPFSKFVNTNFTEVATCIGLTSIFDDDCALTRASVHQTLVLVALFFPSVVQMGLPPALFYFCSPNSSCHLA
jgi:hypothetical protein